MNLVKLRWTLALALIMAGFSVIISAHQILGPKLDTSDGLSEIKAVYAMPSVAGSSQKSSAWFCPGVPGSETSVTSEVVIANPTSTPITGKLTFLSSENSSSWIVLVVQPYSRSFFDATGGAKSRFVSAIVELDSGQASVEQRIIHQAGDSVTLCANRPSDKWFFADGFTGADSYFNILLTNPFPDATVVDVSFTTVEGQRQPAALKGIVIPPRSVYSLVMGDHGVRNESVVAVAVRATAGRLIAGKLQHFLGRGRLGFVSSLGAPAASRQWWFASGQKRDGLDEQFVIFNPTAKDRSVSVAFLTGHSEEGFREPLVLTVPAGRVTTLSTSSLPAITNSRYGVFVSSITDDFVTSSADESGEFVVVEQVTTQSLDNKTSTAISLGGTPSRVWTVPAGFIGDQGEKLVIANTSSIDAIVRISTVGPAGIVAVEGLEQVVLSSATVVEIDVSTAMAQLQILIESDIEILVQRELARGHDLQGRSLVLAIPYRLSSLSAELADK